MKDWQFRRNILPACLILMTILKLLSAADLRWGLGRYSPWTSLSRPRPEPSKMQERSPSRNREEGWGKERFGECLQRLSRYSASGAWNDKSCAINWDSERSRSLPILSDFICTLDLLVKDLIRLFGVRIAVPVDDFDALEESPSGNAPDLFSVLHHGVDVVNHELAGRTRVLTQLLLHQHIKKGIPNGFLLKRWTNTWAKLSKLDSFIWNP